MKAPERATRRALPALVAIVALGATPAGAFATSSISDDEPSWSPDGTTIAFARGGDIYVVNVDGTGLRRLTKGRAADGSPSYSPDGARMAFVRGRRGLEGAAIYLINADGTGLRMLVLGEDPDWSPDGTRLVFADVVDSEAGHIALVNADGTGKRGLTNVDGSIIYDAAPAWSPDGARIAFTRENTTTAEERTSFSGRGGDYVRVMKADGTAGTRLAGSGSDPTWSPDASELAFIRTGINVMRADGTGRRRLTNPVTRSRNRVASDASPAWSPDGAKIAFMREVMKTTRSGSTSRGSIYLVDTDGTHLQRLTNPRRR